MKIDIGTLFTISSKEKLETFVKETYGISLPEHFWKTLPKLKKGYVVFNGTNDSLVLSKKNKVYVLPERISIDFVAEKTMIAGIFETGSIFANAKRVWIYRDNQ